MDINKKIEEIRQKPEHIRIKYVYGALALSMFLILIIWIFSFRESIREITNNKAAKEFSGIREQLDTNADESLPSLESLLEEKNYTGNDTSENNSLSE